MDYENISFTAALETYISYVEKNKEEYDSLVKTLEEEEQQEEEQREEGYFDIIGDEKHQARNELAIDDGQWGLGRDHFGDVVMFQMRNSSVSHRHVIGLLVLEVIGSLIVDFYHSPHAA